MVTVLTQVAVDPKDKAFENPSKPVGPFYCEDQAKKMMEEQGHAMREDAGRGWRRVVPSPHPMEIVPRKAIVDMVRDGICVVCSGGGGIPVVRDKDGALTGVDAVIDKDLAAAVLAADVGADALLILTDVPKAYVAYNTPEQKAPGQGQLVRDGEDWRQRGTSRLARWGPRSTHACASCAAAARRSSPT